MDMKNNQNNEKLSLRQNLFCKYYVETSGNATEAIVKAGYNISKKNGSPDRNLAKSMGSQNLTKPDIMAQINKLLEDVGLNDGNVSIQHLFLINQHVDLGVKTRAIDMYYRLKGKYAQVDNNDSKISEELDRVIDHIRKTLPE